jgi:hypothetical protein
MAVADLDRLIQRLTTPLRLPGQPTPEVSPLPWSGLRKHLRLTALEQIDAVMTAIARESELKGESEPMVSGYLSWSLSRTQGSPLAGATDFANPWRSSP